MLHAPLDVTCFAFSCWLGLLLSLLRCTLFSWRSWFHEVLSASHTLTDSFMHTDAHVNKRVVFLNMLSSVRIPLSAFLRSAFHRHFIFLLQTPADRRSFFSVSAFSWSVSSFHIHFLFFKLLFLIDIYPTLGGGWGCFSRRSPKCAPFSLITLSFYEVLVAGFLLVPLASVSFV